MKTKQFDKPKFSRRTVEALLYCVFYNLYIV